MNGQAYAFGGLPTHRASLTGWIPFVFAIFLGSANAADSYLTIEGTVTDAKGESVVGAKVSMIDGWSDPTIVTGVSAGRCLVVGAPVLAGWHGGRFARPTKLQVVGVPFPETLLVVRRQWHLTVAVDGRQGGVSGSSCIAAQPFGFIFRVETCSLGT